jgi:hypothetical protein
MVKDSSYSIVTGFMIALSIILIFTIGHQRFTNAIKEQSNFTSTICIDNKPCVTTICINNEPCRTLASNSTSNTNNSTNRDSIIVPPQEAI